MKQQWNIDELVEHFTLLPPELGRLGKDAAHNQLGKAILLKYFQYEWRFPESLTTVPTDIVTHIAQQLDIDPAKIGEYRWDSGRAREHRSEIRTLFGFRPATITDQRALRDWLVEEVIPYEYRPAHLEQLARRQMKQMQIEPPSATRLQQRVIRSALHHYAKRLFTTTFERLSDTEKAKLNQLITLDVSLPADDPEVDDDTEKYPLHELKTDSGDAKVKHVKRTAQRLKMLQGVSGLFAGIGRFEKLQRHFTL